MNIGMINPLTAENIKATTELGRILREDREAMRRALDTKPRTAVEIEAANLAEEYRHGAIYMVNEHDGEVVMGCSPSFANVFRAA